jgi:hypothetical protein
MPTDVPGIIEPGLLYVADEARKRLRIGEVSWKKLRDDGLRVIRRGRQAYVFGDDLLRVLDQQRGDE